MVGAIAKQAGVPRFLWLGWDGKYTLAQYSNSSGVNLFRARTSRVDGPRLPL